MSHTLRLLPSIFLVMLLQGCAGNNEIRIAEPMLESQYPALSALEVGQSPAASVSCSRLFTLTCTVRWSGNEIWDDAIIYRNTVDDFSTATEVGREWAEWFGFIDTDVEAGTRYYYWVLFEEKRTGQRSLVSESASVCPTSSSILSCTAPTSPTVETEPDVAEQQLPFPREASEAHYQAVKQPLLATEVQQAPVP